jgi:hypothetical protein
MGINVLNRGNTDADKKIGYFQTLEVQLGSSIGGRYTAMNPIEGKMQQAWNDYLSAQGKSNGLRGTY